MLRQIIVVVLVGSLTLVVAPPRAISAGRASSQTSVSTTVLVTLQPDVDIWMPVSHLIAHGRLYVGQTPIQIPRVPGIGAGVARGHSRVEVASDTPITAALMTSRRARFVFSAVSEAED